MTSTTHDEVALPKVSRPGDSDQRGEGTARKPQPESPDEVVTAAVSMIDRLARELGDSGRPVQAAKLTAESWSAVRTLYPDQAERLSRTLHYLARREAELAPNRSPRNGETNANN